jgi:hypothetical protein
MTASKWKLLAALWFVTIALRIFPYVLERFGELNVKDAFSFFPWNFSPLYAVSLFGGAYLANRGLSMALPVIAYAIVNLAIVLLSGKPSWVNVPEVWVNYALYALLPVFGFGLEKKQSPALPAVGRSFAAAIAFFLASNFVSFLTAYPMTLAGLGDCYWMALPFFPATLVSSLVFTAALFSPVGVKLAVQPAVKSVG